MEDGNMDHAGEPDTTGRAAGAWERVFSAKMRAGAVLVSGLFVLLAVVSRASFREGIVAGVLAAIAVAATVMLLLRQRYAVYAWAFLAATGGVSVALLGEPGHHSILYWGGRFGTALALVWFAYVLFMTGKRLRNGHIG
jgi:hypothetical protein